MNFLDLICGELSIEDFSCRRDRVRGGWICYIRTTSGREDSAHGSLPTSALLAVVSQLRKAA